MGCLTELANVDGLGTHTTAEGLVLTKSSVFVGIRDSVGSITKVDRATGKTSMVAFPSYMNSLVANSTHVFWASGPSIHRAPLAGGSGEIVHTFGANDLCYKLAVDDNNVYCHINQNSPSWFGIYQVPLAGGALIQLSDPMKLIDVNAMLPYGTSLYWGSFNNTFIAYTPIGGGATQTLVRKQAFGSLQTDGTNLFYSLSDGMYRIPLGGGTANLLYSATDCILGALADGALYCISAAGLQKIDSMTGQSTVLLTAKDPRISSIAVDGKSVFGYSQGSVVQLNLL
jgi:hypothetical protein